MNKTEKKGGGRVGSIEKASYNDLYAEQSKSTSTCNGACIVPSRLPLKPSHAKTSWSHAQHSNAMPQRYRSISRTCWTLTNAKTTWSTENTSSTLFIKVVITFNSIYNTSSVKIFRAVKVPIQMLQVLILTLFIAIIWNCNYIQFYHVLCTS